MNICLGKFELRVLAKREKNCKFFYKNKTFPHILLQIKHE